jgi:hypothetical protein
MARAYILNSHRWFNTIPPTTFPACQPGQMKQNAMHIDHACFRRKFTIVIDPMPMRPGCFEARADWTWPEAAE